MSLLLDIYEQVCHVCNYIHLNKISIRKMKSVREAAKKILNGGRGGGLGKVLVKGKNNFFFNF